MVYILVDFDYLISKPKDWTDYSSGRALAKNRAAFYTHRYLLEDLYYIHTFDLDPLEVQDPHLFQAVLYFKSRGDNKNKLEMWFKRDDQEKRRTWTDLLDEIRSKVYKLKIIKHLNLRFISYFEPLARYLS